MPEPGPVQAAGEPGVARPAAGPWPASARFGPQGLLVGGMNAVELASRFGTPLLVFDEAEVRARMREARASFPRVAYAVKAFTAHAVLRLAVQEGLALLCASGGEVEACLRAGVSAERIQLHGNAKTDDELRLAVEAGLGLVIADGPAEMGRLDEVARGAGRVQPVLLRVTPEVAVKTHAAIATGHAASKFGTPLAEAPAAVSAAGFLEGLRFDGLQAHAGSQVLEVEPYFAVVEALVEVALRGREAGGFDARVFDVGGGFGVTYDDESPLPVAVLGSLLRDRLAALVAARGLPLPELQVEPGRALVANAGCTLYRVLDRKRVGGGRELVAVDGGMSDNLRPMLYGAVHAMAAAGPPDGAGTRPVTIVGRHCESGDVLADGVVVPDGLSRGDLVAVAATGAYTYPLASAYNRVGRPAVVAVHEGRATLWLRREDPADLDRLEVAPPHGLPPTAEPPAVIEIRPAAPADARSFVAFWREVVAAGDGVRSERADTPVRVYRRRFRQAWTEEEAHVVAVDADRVVGHVVISRDRHPVTRHGATLAIAVAPSYRRRGIGAALLREACRWAGAMGVEKLLLSVYPTNTAAIALYRRSGFVEEGRLSRQSRKSYGYQDEILMAVWLGPDAASEGAP